MVIELVYHDVLLPLFWQYGEVVQLALSSGADIFALAKSATDSCV